jgi:hypothetical protein
MSVLRHKGLICFIEGGNRTAEAGNLRRAFSELIKRLIYPRQCNPTTKLCGNRDVTLELWSKANDTTSICLIDLDQFTDRRGEDVNSILQSYSKVVQPEQIFYMIVEMESWFLSQPSIFISKNIAKTNGINIRPDEFKTCIDPVSYIKRLPGYGKYSKITDGAILLNKLDATQLSKDFSDVKELKNYLLKYCDDGKGS